MHGNWGIELTTVAGSSPYAWPFSGDLAGSRLALIVAGADAHWIRRTTNGDATLNVIAGLAETLRTIGGIVIRIRHSPAGAAGRWSKLGRHIDLVAGGTDGFYGSELDRTLRRSHRDQLAIVGFGLEGPVHSTLRSANDRGFECITLTDACASLDPTLTEAAFSTICMSGGIFGAIGTSTALTDALCPTTTEHQ